jgi:hypothetical protein
LYNTLPCKYELILVAEKVQKNEALTAMQACNQCVSAAGWGSNHLVDTLQPSPRMTLPLICEHDETNSRSAPDRSGSAPPPRPILRHRPAISLVGPILRRPSLSALPFLSLLGPVLPSHCHPLPISRSRMSSLGRHPSRQQLACPSCCPSPPSVACPSRRPSPPVIRSTVLQICAQFHLTCSVT